ncbi:hypothetical protein [Deinococcus murrayi]|uniref:hypothetical protein n=1 Tax=Deinococcus murrayi TaxID=68910 RepID=UPI000A758D44|nr:hypothetical protein [Deinococcus murrayi]
MEPPSSGSALTPGDDRLRAGFLLWPFDRRPTRRADLPGQRGRAACAVRLRRGAQEGTHP